MCSVQILFLFGIAAAQIVMVNAVALGTREMCPGKIYYFKRGFERRTQ